MKGGRSKRRTEWEAAGVSTAICRRVHRGCTTPLAARTHTKQRSSTTMATRSNAAVPHRRRDDDGEGHTVARGGRGVQNICNCTRRRSGQPRQRPMPPPREYKSYTDFVNDHSGRAVPLRDDTSVVRAPDCKRARTLDKQRAFALQRLRLLELLGIQHPDFALFIK